MYNGSDIYHETAKGGIQVVSVQVKADSAIGADSDAGAALYC
jgi:hypothetical protein